MTRKLVSFDWAMKKILRLIESKFQAKGLKKAGEALDVLKLDEKARVLYQRRQENKMYKESLLYTAKEEGREEGIDEGIDKGKIQVAENLLIVGMDKEFIANVTKLTLEEIEKISLKT